MSDEADVAAEQEQLLLQMSLRLRKPAGPGCTGFCANCGEVVESPKRWCDAECREDWAKREAR